MSKRTFQPNNRRRAKKHGFRARMRTRAGRAILAARRGKRRAALPAYARARHAVLAKATRLTRGIDYRRVSRRGARSAAGHVVTHIVETGESRPARFGFIVSKAVGNAVRRNLIRRRLKAICA